MLIELDSEDGMVCVRITAILAHVCQIAYRLFGVAALLLVFTGCAQHTIRKADDFARPTPPYRVLIMPVDVEVGRRTAMGKFERVDEWSQEAHAHVTDAVLRHQAGTTTDPSFATEVDNLGLADEEIHELLRLHHAIIEAITLHQIMTPIVRLPTKGKRLDWPLGNSLVDLGKRTGHDYALMIRVEDSFSTAGNWAMQAVGLTSCLAISLCVMPQSGLQYAFASLVDLRTGKIVWFNRLVSELGDVRTPEGARLAVWGLLTYAETAEGVESNDHTHDTN